MNTKEFNRGAWCAFNEVLGWLNQQKTARIDIEEIYGVVMNMTPESIRYQEQEALLAGETE